MIRALAAALLAVAVLWPVTSAHARIVCKDGFQNVGGEWIATPYCEDDYLAEVARDHGMNVSASSVRNDPGVKEEACKLVGYDTRVREDCHKYYDPGGSD
jgi:hypothetical protein